MSDERPWAHLENGGDTQVSRPQDPGIAALSGDQPSPVSTSRAVARAREEAAESDDAAALGTVEPPRRRSGVGPVALLLLFAVLIGIGAIAGLLAARSDRSSPSAEAADSVTTDDEATSGEDEAGGDSADGTGTDGTGSTASNGTSGRVLESSTVQTEAESTVGGSEDDTDSGEASVPTAPPVGSIRPAAQCRFDLLAPVLDAGAVTCDQGSVVIEGDDARWHNDVTEIFLSEGASATIEFEARSDGSFDGDGVVDFGPGTSQLNRADAAYGISVIVVNFTGADQHIHLDGDRGSRDQFSAFFSPEG